MSGRIEAGGSVYVEGTHGAYNTDIIASGNIECSSYSACSSYYGDIENSQLKAGGYILLDGPYAAFLATITASDGIACNDHYSCAGARIASEGCVNVRGQHYH